MKLVFLRILSYFPRQLPVGMTAFNTWSSRIITLCGPLADETSMRFALASQIMHLPPQSSKRADQYFIRSMLKSAANQVASQVFQDIKTKQQEQQQAQIVAAATEVTTPDVSSKTT
jgi:hypothetical protein